MRTILVFALWLQFFSQDDDVGKLIQQLGSSSFEEQGKAAKALEELGTKAIPALKKAKEGNSPQVAEWARKILLRIEEQEKKRAEEEARKTEEELNRGRREIESLISQLGDSDFEAQGKAAERLKKWGSVAIPFLKDAFRKNEDLQIREWAGRLLMEMGERAASFGGTEQRKGPFASRFSGLYRHPESEKILSSALAWLARHQDQDGGWSSLGPRGQGCKCSIGGEREHDPGVTGLALLVFLGAGHTHLSKESLADPKDSKKQYALSDVVQRALSWLLLLQEPDGRIGGEGDKPMYDHAITTLALAEAYGMTGAEELKGPAQKAVDFIVSAQNPGKGWRYTVKAGENDTSITCWCVQALKAAGVSGLTVPMDCFGGACDWLDEVTEDQYYRVGYTYKGSSKVYVPNVNEGFDHHESLTAAAIWVRAATSAIKEKTWNFRGIELLTHDLPEWTDSKADAYYWYYGTMALYQYKGFDGPDWKKWTEALRKALSKGRRADGCAGGSWNPEEDRWGTVGGRIATTALAALALETAYRYPQFAK